MKHNIALIAFICSIFIIGKQNIASAQSQPSNFKYQLIYVSTGFVNMQNDSVYSRTCCVELPDSINISKIIVKAGTQETFLTMTLFLIIILDYQAKQHTLGMD